MPSGRRAPDPSDGEAFRRWDRELDCAGLGRCCLNQAEVGRCVRQVIQSAESERDLCRLHGFVVMPNHVHVLLTPHRVLWEVTKWIKGASARRANQILNSTGTPFWQDESYDHWVRSQAEFARILNYIGRNPVLAGLVY